MHGFGLHEFWLKVLYYNHYKCISFMTEALLITYFKKNIFFIEKVTEFFIIYLISASVCRQLQGNVFSFPLTLILC